MRTQWRSWWPALVVVLVSRAPAYAGWGSPETIENAVGTGPVPIAVDNGGVAHVAYTLDDNRLRWKTRVPSGRGHSWVEVWPDGPKEAYLPDIAVDAQRNVYLIWDAKWAADTTIVRFRCVGANKWAQDGAPVPVPGVRGYWPQVRVGPTGRVHVIAYCQQPDGSRQVLYTFRRSWDGEWSEVTALDASSPLQGVIVPAMCIGANEDAHIVYPWSDGGHKADAKEGDTRYVRLRDGRPVVGPLNVTSGSSPDKVRSYHCGVGVDDRNGMAYVAVQQNDGFKKIGVHTWVWTVGAEGSTAGPFDASPQDGSTNPIVAVHDGRVDVLSQGTDPESKQIAPFVFTLGSSACEEPIPGKRLTSARFCKDAAGNDYVTVRNTTDLKYQFAMRRNEPSRWSAPVNVSGTPGKFSVRPAMAFDWQGNMHVAIEEFLDLYDRLFYANNVGGSWQAQDITPEEHINSRIIEPALALTPDGVLHIIYATKGVYRDPDSRPGIWEITKPVSGGEWSKPEPLHACRTGEGTAMGWAAVDDSGGIYVNYLVLPWAKRNPGQLYGRYKPRAGAWGREELLAQSSNGKWPSARKGNPSHGGYLICDGKRYYLTYSSDKAYLVIRDERGLWGDPIAIGESGGSPRVAISPKGELAVAYHQNVGDPPGDWFDVFVAFSQDGGRTWSKPYNVVPSPSYLDRDPEIVFDERGRFHVCWQKFVKDGDQPDIWMRARVNGKWGEAEDITNTVSRTGTPLQALRVHDGKLHFLYCDNAGDGFEEVYHRWREARR